MLSLENCGAKKQCKFTEECINRLNRLAKSRKVTSKWVKAHVGHSGNEIANELAQMGACNRPFSYYEIEE